MKNLILLAAFIVSGITGMAQSKNFIDQPYLEVNGSADTLVTPNEIYIRIIISEKDNRDKVSVEDQEMKMVNTLKSSGINTEKDLTTDDMTSTFRSYLLKSKDILKTKQYVLKVKDAITASLVLIRLEDIDISNISIDRVDNSEMENIKNMMHSKAIENAKATAIAMTKPLNQTLGSAIYIADNENYTTGNMLEGRAKGIVVTGYGYDKSMHQEKVSEIQFEKIKITANYQCKIYSKVSIVKAEYF